MNSNHKKHSKTILLSAMLLALGACSSEDDESPGIEPSVNAAPTFTSTNVTNIDEDSAYEYTVTASDSDGDTLTLAAGTVPNWLTFDAATGVLSGTPLRDDVGDHAVSITVSDGTDTATLSFTITVSLVNSAPMVSSTAITSADQDSAYAYTLTATDSDGDALTFSATTLPSWLMFDANSGVLSGTPAEADVGDHDVVLSVSDGIESSTDTFVISVAGAPMQSDAALVIYNDAANPMWASWDCCGSTTATIEDAGGDYGNVTQFTIAGATVVGFTTREVDGAVGGTPFNADSIASTGTLEFDLKLITAPATTPDWLLKVESNNAAEFAQVSLSTAQEGHASPIVDTWQHYTFNLADLQTAGLDLTSIDVAMIFPAWGEGDGAVFQVDNVQFMAEGSDATVVDPVDPVDPTATTGDLTIYETDIQPNWLAWDCCGGTTPMTVTEGGDFGEVTEFTINGDTVVGFSTRSGHGATNGVKHDATSILDTGTLSFDLKMTASPGDTDWKIKVESDEGATHAELSLTTSNEGHTGPVLDTWQTYTFNLKDLANAGLDHTNIDIVMMYPAWGTGSGAVFRVDNVKINATGATASSQPSLPLTFEDTAFNYVLTDFGGTTSSIVADPDSAGSRGMVAKSIKLGDAQTWAGTTASGDDGFADVFPLAADKTVMQVWVYAPEAGMTVRLKVEESGDATRSVETDATTTMANTWELLSFDFANQADGTAALDLSYSYDKASIFFNFGVDGATAGEKTFYWDQLDME